MYLCPSHMPPNTAYSSQNISCYLYSVVLLQMLPAPLLLLAQILFTIIDKILWFYNNKENYVTDEEEWDVGPDGPIKTPNNLLDEILVDMVELLKKLNLENKVLLEAVLQVIGMLSC